MMNIVPRSQWLSPEHIFDDFFALNKLKGTEGYFEPRVDIIEKDDKYVFVAELPGVEKKDINVQLQDGLLTIEAKMHEEKESEVDNVIRKEIRSGFFSRSINVGKNIKEGEIKAELVNGLLKLTAPKAKPTGSEVRKIQIS
ncbi:MAG TPA: Hsp20/alpha crystallin family protein [Psychromonas sp.]